MLYPSELRGRANKSRRFRHQLKRFGVDCDQFCASWRPMSVILQSTDCGLLGMKPDVVRRTDASFEIGSQDSLTSGMRERRAWKGARRTLGPDFKCVIGNNPVHDVPSLERRYVIVVGCVNDFAPAVWPAAGAELMRASTISSYGIWLMRKDWAQFASKMLGRFG